MHYNSNSRLKTYDIHPISIKQILKGHPWILADKFTEKFNPREKFIVAVNRRRPFALLLHDPTHPIVKARLWSKEGNFEKQIKSFKKDVMQRINDSIKHRRDLKVLNSRENIYLVFGEADKLPGINILLLNDQLLFQFYGNFWESYQNMIIETTLESLNKILKVNLTKGSVWVQKRETGERNQKYPVGLNPNLSELKFEVEEYGVKYELQLGNSYDVGVYTDMASIREKLSKTFSDSKSVLNLYSYTGAFSLFAMNSGAKEVTSVDLSKKYLSKLEHNISLNSFEDSNHQSVCAPCLDALADFKDGQFDLIICDPPSSSNNGKKRSNALKDYESLLPLMNKVLANKGKMIIFLNTHRTGRKKFEIKVQEILTKPECKGLIISKKLHLSQDCPTLKGFPEGDYLKGLILEKND